MSHENNDQHDDSQNLNYEEDQEQKEDMTLNSLENHPDKVANEVANMIHNNRRGSNF